MTPLFLRSNPILKLNPLNLPQRFSPHVFALATYLSSPFAFSLPCRHAKLSKSPYKHVKEESLEFNRTLPLPHLASAPCTDEGYPRKDQAVPPSLPACFHLLLLLEFQSRHLFMSTSLRWTDCMSIADRLICEYLLFLSHWEGCVSLTVSLPLLLSLQPAAAVYLF